jgi:hypothetical protein
MNVCLFCLLSVVQVAASGTNLSLIQRSATSRVYIYIYMCVCVCLILCDIETSKMRRLRPELGCCAIERRKYGKAFALPALPPYLISAKPHRQRLPTLWNFSASWMNHKIIERSLPVTEPRGIGNFSVAGSFRLIQVLEIKIIVIPDHLGCKHFR